MAGPTKEEFLNEYQSPYISWGCDGEKKKPTDDKIRQGFVIEQPKHDEFNWLLYRGDERLKALEAKVAWLENYIASQNQ